MAERIAHRSRDKVLLVDKRPHVGGNCYDFTNEAGHLIPLYGPHYFHTNDEAVWAYVQRFSEWVPYEHRVKSLVDGKLVPVPVNITTVNQLFGLELSTSDQMQRWLADQVVTIPEPKNSRDSALSRVGPVLYEKMFRDYTKKQWDLFPEELDAQVMNRIPVRTDFDDRYFSDKYQAMPKHGYTELFRAMLDHPNIELVLGVDYLKDAERFGKPNRLYFTGRIDQFFESQGLPALRYRSLRFEFETLPRERYQEAATVNFPSLAVPYTRVTEPKLSTGQTGPQTTLIREYPTWEGEPYYPVFSPENQKLYGQYQALAAQAESSGVYFVGRLANFRYFNMDQAFANALNVAAKGGW